jgi:hypothetical protein
MAQETLEEAFSSYVNEKYHSPTQGSIPDLESARFGAKWQAGRMYSEEVVRNAYRWGTLVNHGTKEHFNEWFEKVKKK